MRTGTLDEYREHWNSMVVLEDWKPRVLYEARRVLARMDVNKRVQKVSGVPWVFTACVHELEGDSNPKVQILNGQRWDRVTTIEPVGRGPWPSWEAAAVHALKYKREKDKSWRPLDELTDWTIALLLREWERWNGGGYLTRGLPSPYVWSATKRGLGVGYYESDGKYNAKAASEQVGCAALLKQIIEWGEWANPLDDAA